ncbi:MAG: hypothetical protein HZB67_03175 [Candidatus Aenigmarchaeota archaeon]|nr:hypothetical protein [Candidatus Aenigmarchaeota archaeon]
MVVEIVGEAINEGNVSVENLDPKVGGDYRDGKIVINWRNKADILLLHTYYDRALVTLILPSAVTVTKNASATFRTDNGINQILGWIITKPDKLIEPSFDNNRIQVEVIEPDEYNYNAYSSIQLQLGPFDDTILYASDGINEFEIPVYNYSKWASKPKEVYWYTISTSSAKKEFSTRWADILIPFFNKTLEDTILVQDMAHTVQVPLDKYVWDSDTPLRELTWTIQSASNVKIDVNPESHIATIDAPDWSGEEKINFVVGDKEDHRRSGIMHVMSIASSGIFNSSISPSTGTGTTLFTYSVVYKNPSGVFPRKALVYVDGIPHEMRKISGGIATGATFSYSTYLSSSNNWYYFLFDDGTQQYRYPETGVLSGPTVTAGASLLEGMVDPASGTEAQTYSYYVKYKSLAGEPPEYVTVFIGSEWKTMWKVSGDYQTGALYKATANLKPGPHIYYFKAKLYSGEEIRYPASGTLNGPSITQAGTLQVIVNTAYPPGRTYYNPGEHAEFNIDIKDPSGNYVDVDLYMGYPKFYLYRFPPGFYLTPIEHVGTGRYHVYDYMFPLGNGYTSFIFEAHKEGFFPGSAAIELAVGEIPSIVPINITSVEADGFYNPDFGNITIFYNITKDAQVTIRVLDSMNNPVRTLLDHATRNAGTNSEIWNGKDNYGNSLPDDKYVIQLEALNISDFAFSTQFGVDGQGTGNLLLPTGVGLGPDEKVYIADYSSNRKIAIYTFSSGFVNEIKDPDDLPLDVAVDSENYIYALIWSPSTMVYIRVFKPDRNPDRAIVIPGLPSVSDPIPSIDIDIHDNIYVASSNKFFVLYKNATLECTPDLGGNRKITGIAGDEYGNIWVAHNEGELRKYDKNCNLLMTISVAPGNPSQNDVGIRKGQIVYYRSYAYIDAYDLDGTQLHRYNVLQGDTQEMGITVNDNGYIFTTGYPPGKSADYHMFRIVDLSSKDVRRRDVIINRDLPTAIITSPLNNQTIYANSTPILNIIGTANASNFDYYVIEFKNFNWSTIYVGNNTVNSSILARWNLSEIVSGTYPIKLTVYDKTGAYSHSIINITIKDAKPPTSKIVSPMNGSIVTKLTVVEAESSDIDIDSIEFQFRPQDGSWAAIGNKHGYPYFIEWNTRNLTSGNYSLRTVAKDTAGNSKASAAIAVLIDNMAPSARINNLANNTSIMGVVIINASSSDTDITAVSFQYKLHDDLIWIPIGSSDTSPPFSTKWNVTRLLLNEYYDMRAVATDNVGNSDENASVITARIGILGDINSDCIVNIFDLAAVGLCFGKPPTGSCEMTDINRDGKINIFDLAAVGLNFGRRC